MAAIVPNTVSDKITFFTSHVTGWAADPLAIGTTAERVALVQAKLDEAKAARLARAQAVDAARSATLRLKMALAELSHVGAQVIAEVKAKAAVDGKSIYPRASLPVPAAPSPLGKPGKPTNLSVELLSGMGVFRLSWKCRHPRGAKGTMYQVYRRLGADGEFAFLGASGKKKYTDATMPAGTRFVSYRIVAVRSTARGDVAEFNVNLGISGKLPSGMHVPGEQLMAA